MLGSPSRLWMEIRTVLKSYRAGHLSSRMSRQVSPWMSTPVVAGPEELHHGRIAQVATGDLQGELNLRSPCAVPAAPWMVLTRWQRLSDSGKAEIPLLPDIMRTISSCCNLLPTGPQAAPPLGSAPLRAAATLVAPGSWFWEAIQAGTGELREHDCNCLIIYSFLASHTLPMNYTNMID